MDSDFQWKAVIYGLHKIVAQFHSKSVLTSLQTKDNLYKWGKLTLACNLCGDYKTVAHMVSVCNSMLDQGRYT